MRFLDRLLNRPPNQDDFAALLLKRIRASGDTRPIAYDPGEFRLRKPNNSFSFLGNIYQEYLRATKAEREQLLRAYLAMWHTTELPLPESFDDVRADILPALRARSYFEIDLQRAGGARQVPMPPYEIVAEHLALSLVYDLPTSMMSLNDEALDNWGISFYEAMEVAKSNLRDKAIQYAEIGSMYAMASGDSYDATRMVLLDLVHGLRVSGESIAMVPNRERLYIAGSDDAEGLATMLKLVEEDVQHERFISGMAFQLVDDQWSPWLPSRDHPLYQQFRLHQFQTVGQMYSEQADLLNARFQQTGEDAFAATFSGLQDESSGALTSYCMWAQGIDSLLPETDEIFLVRPNGDGVDLVARAAWETVCRQADALMEPQGIYPERWRVREFPDQSTLDRIVGP